MTQSADARIQIPEEWLAEAGAAEFMPITRSYIYTPSSSANVVEIVTIRPPTRSLGVEWFEKERMLAILEGIVAGEPLPPVEVHKPPDLRGYRFAVKNGFHRFYASISLGFPEIPVVEREYFDIHAL